MSNIKEIIVYEVDGKTFASKAEAESHLALKEFEEMINELKEKVLECQFISPHFRVTYHAFSSEQLDKALELAKDIELLVNKVRKYQGG